MSKVNEGQSSLGVGMLSTSRWVDKAIFRWVEAKPWKIDRVFAGGVSVPHIWAAYKTNEAT